MPISRFNEAWLGITLIVFCRIFMAEIFHKDSQAYCASLAEALCLYPKRSVLNDSVIFKCDICCTELMLSELQDA